MGQENNYYIISIFLGGCIGFLALYTWALEMRLGNAEKRIKTVEGLLFKVAGYILARDRASKGAHPAPSGGESNIIPFPSSER